MGSSGSRLGGSSPPPYRPRHGHHRTRFKRALSSIFICGAFPSSEPAHEVEDDPAEKLVNSAVNNDMEKIQIPAKNSSSPTGAGSEFSNRTTETVVGQERNMLPGVNSSREYTRGHVDASDKGKSLSMNKDLYFTRSFLNSRSNDASTSYEDEQSHQPESSNASANTDTPNRGKSIRNGDAPQSCAGFMLSNCPSSDGGESLSDEVSVENCANEVMVFHDCDSGSVSVLSESPPDETSQQTYPSGLGFLVTERDRGHPDGNVLQVDVVSVSSDMSSSSFSELSNHEARRNSRRLFWDAFSRRSSRRSAESRSLLFTTDDPDGLESHDRWLLDFNGDFFDEGIGVDFRSYASSNQNTNERHWHSSSEIQERFHDVGRNGTDRRVATCPAGIHPDGACSCNSMLRAEESGARASISRIVMLAEALFEVLDDIHRQPMSLSLSMVSLPAPESIVDSFPVKDHKKPERLESGDDVAQCYICLAEYEEGDKIRILPCRHEFHVMCIDKWLKEIHGVCPLCRGDVREGFSSTEDTVSRSEVPSL